MFDLRLTYVCGRDIVFTVKGDIKNVKNLR